MAKLMQFPPQKKKKFPPTNKSKYCKFHWDYNHETNDCITLNDEIETLIRREKLAKCRQYGKRKAEEGKTQGREQSHSPRQREVSDKVD